MWQLANIANCKADICMAMWMDGQMVVQRKGRNAGWSVGWMDGRTDEETVRLASNYQCSDHNTIADDGGGGGCGGGGGARL